MADDSPGFVCRSNCSSSASAFLSERTFDVPAAAFVVTSAAVERDAAASAVFVARVSARAVGSSPRWHSALYTVDVLCLASVEVSIVPDPASWPCCPAVFDITDPVWCFRYSEPQDAGTPASPSGAPDCSNGLQASRLASHVR